MSTTATNNDIVWFRRAFWVAWAAVTVLALWPLQHPLIPVIGDKIKHGLAFFALSLLAERGWSGIGFWPKQAIYLMLYGIAIELVQYFIPNREFSFADWVADGVGILLYQATQKWVLLCCRA